uniref:Uncharacterized protein n=1 Tax=Romanomermis culicivorax TaxID=13658 RepID=A0A915K7V5_ROMCU
MLSMKNSMPKMDLCSSELANLRYSFSNNNIEKCQCPYAELVRRCSVVRSTNDRRSDSPKLLHIALSLYCGLEVKPFYL